nr:hypothetical protein OG296_36170 [Streptomyces sp. NBC_01001]
MWLTFYRSSLALLDLLAAALLISGKRRGTDLACAVMTTDLAAQPGLQRLVTFTAFVLGTAPFVRRHLAS